MIMGKKVRIKDQKVKSVYLDVVRTKVSLYWNPLPFNKRDKFIPSSVDCLFHQDYYNREEAKSMLIAL